MVRSSPSTPSSFSTFSDVAFLRVGLVMREIPHMQDQVGLQHLFERGAERGDQLRRQVGDKADRVGEDDAPARGQLQPAHGGIEGREQHVLRQHLG